MITVISFFGPLARAEGESLKTICFQQTPLEFTPAMTLWRDASILEKLPRNHDSQTCIAYEPTRSAPLDSVDIREARMHLRVGSGDFCAPGRVIIAPLNAELDERLLGSILFEPTILSEAPLPGLFIRRTNPHQLLSEQNTQGSFGVTQNILGQDMGTRVMFWGPDEHRAVVPVPIPARDRERLVHWCKQSS